MVPTIYYLFWAKMLSQQSPSQKRPWLDTKNRHFSPLHQTTPSVNPWLWAHLPCIGWIHISGDLAIMQLSYYFLLLFSFFPMPFLPLIFGFVSFCSWILSTHTRLLWRMVWAYWACRTFASSWACLLLFFARLTRWALFPSLLSFGLLQPFVSTITY